MCHIRTRILDAKLRMDLAISIILLLSSWSGRLLRDYCALNVGAIAIKMASMASMATLFFLSVSADTIRIA